MWALRLGLFLLALEATFAFYWSTVHIRTSLWNEKISPQDAVNATMRDVSDALAVKIREIGVRVSDQISKNKIQEAQTIIDKELKPAQRAFEDAQEALMTKIGKDGFKYRLVGNNWVVADGQCKKGGYDLDMCTSNGNWHYFPGTKWKDKDGLYWIISSDGFPQLDPAKASENNANPAMSK